MCKLHAFVERLHLARVFKRKRSSSPRPLIGAPTNFRKTTTNELNMSMQDLVEKHQYLISTTELAPPPSLLDDGASASKQSFRAPALLHPVSAQSTPDLLSPSCRTSLSSRVPEMGHDGGYAFGYGDASRALGKL